MKSLLEKAPSVIKAIEKAWKSAGKPDQFTIKVFESEKKGFLGFVKKPAIISILYEPSISSEREIPSYKSLEKGTTRGTRSFGFSGRTVVPSAIEKQADKWERVVWQPEFIMDISRWLKELVELTGSKRIFTINEDRSVLNIRFDKPVINELEYERMLFSSFAYLLMQFLKRKHRSKFRGLRLSIRSIR